MEGSILQVCGFGLLILAAFVVLRGIGGSDLKRVEEDMETVRKCGGQRWPDDRYVRSPSRMRSLLRYATVAKEDIYRLLALEQVTRLLSSPATPPELRQICQHGVFEIYPSFLKNERSDLQRTAIRAVAATADARAVPLLIGLLNDPSNWIRGQAARSLGDIGDSRAVQPLVAVLRSDRFEISYLAALALNRLGWQPDAGIDPGSASVYWTATRQWDRCVELGASAVAPILAWAANYEIKDRPLAHRYLEIPFLEEDKAVVAATLHRIGTPALDALVAALRAHTENWNARHDITLWMTSISDGFDQWPKEKRGSPEFLHYLESQLSCLHQAAYEVLSAIHDPNIVDPLLAALDDPDPQTRELTAKLLGEMPDPRAVGPLAAHFERLPVALVAETLAKIGGAEAKEALAANLERGQVAVARPLALLGDDRGIAWLIESVRKTGLEESAMALGLAYRSLKLTAIQKQQIMQHGDLNVYHKMEEGAEGRDDLGYYTGGIVGYTWVERRLQSYL